jgi:hypothetical protein
MINPNLKVSKYLRQLNYWRIQNKNAEKYRRRKIIQKHWSIQKKLGGYKNIGAFKIFGGYQNLGASKIFGGCQNLGASKSLADAKTLVHPKSLAPTEILAQQEK